MSVLTLHNIAQSSDAEPTEEIKLNQQLVRAIQAGLRHQRFNPGPEDGVWGNCTATAYAEFCKEYGFDAELVTSASAHMLSGETNPVAVPLLKMGDGDNGYLRRPIEMLQKLLKQNEAPISTAVDGIFGSATHFEVRSFQRGHNLLEDGVVGRETWEALLKKVVLLYRPHKNTVLAGIRVDEIIDSISQPTIRAAARKSVPEILKTCELSNVFSKFQIAYILATAYHESHLGRWMREFSTGVRYEPPSEIAKQLGNTKLGDGAKFIGRGYVQITGRINYKKWSDRLKIDLITNPFLASDPKVAAQILVEGMREGSFTGKSLKDYINDHHCNFVEARRIVNGTDKATTVASIANDFLAAM